LLVDLAGLELRAPVLRIGVERRVEGAGNAAQSKLKPFQFEIGSKSAAPRSSGIVEPSAVEAPVFTLFLAKEHAIGTAAPNTARSRGMQRRLDEHRMLSSFAVCAVVDDYAPLPFSPVVNQLMN
jgi:hypothetical protein